MAFGTGTQIGPYEIFGYAFREPPAPSDDGQRRTNVRYRLVWKEGRAGIGEGEHVLGRDPDLALFLDSSTAR